MLDHTLDPEITPAMFDTAHTAEPAEYPDTDVHDDLDELGAGTVTPATPAQALQHAWFLNTDGVYVGVGYCLKTVRDPEFRIPALYPDAETAWEEADQKHPTADPHDIPRGAVVFWTNGRHGHVALSAGGGLCWTTDYRRPGYVDLAPIASLASWCGGTLVGWAEDLNGIDVWPNERPARPPFGLDEWIVVVKNALRRARDNKASKRRIDGLKKWLAQLEAKKAAK